MKTLAAILVETGKPLALEEIELPPLQSGQVLVEIKFSGVCHTQLSECRGYRGHDPYLPHCLGHEGSGVVMETGPCVDKVKAGDPVLLSWMKGEGSDVASTIYFSRIGKVNSGAITTFSRLSIVSENRLTRLPPNISFLEAALLGCAVPTGVGAVFNTAQARAGQSLVVFGAGGIGLCAVAGGVLAGCEPIVAVDIRANKLEIAKQMGATHVVQVNGNDPASDLREICRSGFDLAVEASGRTIAMQQALEAVRTIGGIAVILGNSRFGEKLEIDPRQLNQGKQLRGSWGGDNCPSQDFPRYFEFLSSGALNIKPLTSAIYTLENINTAIDDLEKGEVIRPLIQVST